MSRENVNPMPSLYEILEDTIPGDHSRQTSASEELQTQITNGFRPSEVLDLGCGDGRSIDLFSSLLPNASWTGIDIEISPEVSMRKRSDGNFVTFDGIHMPFESSSFGLVYTYQVLEHVRYPDKLLAEVRRIIKDEGMFIGQTSQLEPYHSYSYWNYTLFGFKELLKEAGFHLTVLRPGIDGLTLIKRALLGRPKEWSKWFSTESPLNRKIEENLVSKRPIKVRNYRKLIFCGQFTFVAIAM